MKLSELKRIMSLIPPGAETAGVAWRNEYLQSLGIEYRIQVFWSFVDRQYTFGNMVFFHAL